ncbi:glycosyltransferase [Arthrobacter rhombi]|uniref:Glycosyl transferase, group 1 family protein n=1 Tax=Arthrobacter rhombi TaxID=71253 RepID=A0A1R4GUD0_9MICC|nr:glycosyltransferase [Arthrobacter rhombi]SJM71673.1 Glycosyl transferase, group 1 family protein [Arthrobacter rhombi]
MRILVCPHQLGMGGSQLNAIEMAVAVRRHGHEAVVYAPSGVLCEALEATGVPWIEAPVPSSRNGAWTRRLGQTIKREHVDLIHTYEWRPGLQAAFASGLRTPTLMSVMSMQVPSFLPTHLPLVVGTPDLQQRMEAEGRTAYLMEPPVDMSHHMTRDEAGARKSWGIGELEVVISVVSMLTTDLEKLQGVLTAISVVDRLAETHRVRLLIAGDGEGLATVQTRAEQVNLRHGRTVIQPVGFLLDPAPVYEAADIVLGMGSSAIKGLAHSKAVIVQGEGGFWKTLDENTAEEFMTNGWFGQEGAGVRDLLVALTDLLEDPWHCRRLGAFGRQLVERRYSLAQAGTDLAGIYVETVMRPQGFSTTTRSLARSAIESAKYFATMQFGSVVDRETWARQGANS